MKVIKQGVNSANRVYRGTCMHCMTQVEFEAREAHRVPDQRDGDYLQVNCPTCDRHICVAANRFCI